MSVERKATRYAHSDGHTDVCYSQSGDKLLTCGTDGDIRIWAGFDDDDPVQTCAGEWSLCIIHNGDNLYVATDNETIQMLKYPEGDRHGILKRFGAPVNHMTLSKDNKYIVVACEDSVLQMIALDDINDTTDFTGINGPSLSVAICPKTKYLAASSGDTYLRVWNVEDKKIVKEIKCVPKVNSFMNAKSLCRMDFDYKTGHYLAYPEENVVQVLNINDWTNKWCLKCVGVDEAYSIVKYSICGNYLAAASLKGDVVIWEMINGTVSSHTTHDKSIAICALTWNPSGNGELAYCDVEGQLGVIINCVALSAENPVNDFFEDECFEEADDKISLYKGDEDEDDEDNENAISIEKLKKDIMGDGSDDEKDEVQTCISTPRPKTPEIPLQDSFMPSSTPCHLDPRYMCWNDVAVIRCYGGSLDEDAETGKYIEVEFHDYSFHNSMMIQNYHNYFLGTVSRTALVIASLNLITVVPLTSSTKEWSLTVEGEEIVCVACSKNLLCFATTNYFIRVCSIYGIQKSIFRIPGPVISMAAFNNYLLVAYHSGSIRKMDQCININLVKLEGFSIESVELNACVSPESHLQWIGFTDLGTPIIMDSLGIVSIYPLKCKTWIPVLDTTKLTKSPADGFFVTTVYESLQTIRGVICKGGMFPGFTPRPTQSEHPLQPPFLELSSERVTFETSLFTNSMFQTENAEKKLKEAGLKAFALACKSNLEERAFELIEMFNNHQLLSLAIKFATRMDKRRLVEKLNSLCADVQEDKSLLTPPVKPSNKRLTLNLSAKSVTKKKNDIENSPCDKATPEPISEKTPSLNTQDSLFSHTQEKESPANPFALKSKNTKNNSYNPISLTDTSAGIATTDKRKITDGANDEPKGKHRKLF